MTMDRAAPIEKALPVEVVRKQLDRGRRQSFAKTSRPILAAGSRAVPALIALLREEPEDDPFASEWVVDILMALGDPRGIEAMLEIVANDEPLQVFDHICGVLPELGETILDPLLALHVRTTSESVRDSLLWVLADLGVQDLRILELLLAKLRSDPGRGAIHLGVYGDPSVMNELIDAFDRAPNPEDLEPGTGYGQAGNNFSNKALEELKEAIERLGGHLRPEQLTKFKRGDEVQRQNFMQGNPSFRRNPELGQQLYKSLHGADDVDPRFPRSRPCWCGSGLKYKKCHLLKEAPLPTTS